MTRTPAFWITPVLLALFAPQATTASDITLTGCIERLDKTGAAYGAAAAGNRNPPSTFALTKAKLTSGTRASTVPEVPELSDKARTGTTGTTGTTTTTADARSATPSTYQLVGNDRELSTHAGHRVEITGTLDALPHGEGRTADSATAANTTEWDVVVPKLKVATVKTLDASCAR
jgi:hypothetical protein